MFYKTEIANLLENALFLWLQKREDKPLSSNEIDELEIFGLTLMGTKVWCKRPGAVCLACNEHEQGLVDSSLNDESAENQDIGINLTAEPSIKEAGDG